jgi:hypothetical protein
MLARVRARLTYANVVSTICLFVVLGGGAYAAVQLPPKSVGTKQLKNKAVKRVKIAKHAVTGPKLAPDAVTGPKVDESTLGRVPEAQHANLATDAATLNDHTFDYFEAAQRTEFGSANQKSIARAKILEWSNANAEVLTDGDADATPAVRVRNTSAPNGGDLLVVESDGNPVVVTEGQDSPELAKGNAGDLHFVVARPDGRTIWVRCAFLAFATTPVRCLGERSGPN